MHYIKNVKLLEYFTVTLSAIIITIESKRLESHVMDVDLKKTKKNNNNTIFNNILLVEMH